LPEAKFSFRDRAKQHTADQHVDARDFATAIRFLFDWLDDRVGLSSLDAVGHRVVHGMRHAEPERVTPELVAELRQLIPVDPDHLPAEIALMEAFAERRPNLPQVACFDTAYHRTMPRVASLLPIPRRYSAEGVQRYGFHGISYAYLMEELARVAGEKAANGRVILAHLGNGASLAAVRDGHSIDTSMGFTPAGGIPMGTRTGDLDPGVAWYLMDRERMSSAQFNKLINQQSGLLGMSETGSDMRELLARESNDGRAAEAVGVFCYQIKKWIGSFAAALGGLDTLVFSGGIGENAPAVRARVCEGLEFLGIDIDPVRNVANATVISRDDSRATVRVIRTDEQWMIAKSVCRLLRLD
jgi:acetate kinase